ncbi:hypothetical protein NPIL_124931 [Nephila pilipes]|uniref:Uncharacterized protein n=1 Tax=Nephila pilipes TaxID=299642 RepID=A0A8X6QMG9_NEPPI|nr:hypothetical protein NPIL_124931 [Nephila pilipes]
MAMFSQLDTRFLVSAIPSPSQSAIWCYILFFGSINNPHLHLYASLRPKTLFALNHNERWEYSYEVFCPGERQVILTRNANFLHA